MTNVSRRTPHRPLFECRERGRKGRPFPRRQSWGPAATLSAAREVAANRVDAAHGERDEALVQRRRLRRHLGDHDPVLGSHEYVLSEHAYAEGQRSRPAPARTTCCGSGPPCPGSRARSRPRPRPPDHPPRGCPRSSRRVRPASRRSGPGRRRAVRSARGREGSRTCRRRPGAPPAGRR